MNDEASTSVRVADRSGGIGPQALCLPSVGASAARARHEAFVAAAAWIDQALRCWAEAVERMLEPVFMPSTRPPMMRYARRRSTWSLPC